jgi:hypothetical protein
MKKQIIVVSNGDSYTFTVNEKDQYDTSHPHASPRNVTFLNSIGEGGKHVNIQSVKDKLKNK